MHLRGADMSTDSVNRTGHHETFRCPVCHGHHQVPREPEQYRPTDHFYQMYRDRDVPAGAIADCIKDGACKRDHTGESSRRFEAIVAGERWRVVVELDPDVIHGPAEAHTAVTICHVTD